MKHKRILILWSLLVFSMLAFPRNFQGVKLTLLLLLLFDSIRLKRSITLSKYHAVFIAMWFAYYTLAALIGWLYGNNLSGILDSLRLNILFMVLLVFIGNRISAIYGSYAIIYRTILYASLYIGIYNVLIVLLAYGEISLPLLAFLDPTARVGIHVGYSHNVSTNLSMSMVALPYALFSLKDNSINCHRALSICAIAALSLAMFLSGRRILWLVLILNVLLCVFYSSKNTRRVIRNFFILFVLLVSCTILLLYTKTITLSGIIQRFINAFISQQNDNDASIRYSQMIELYKGFKYHPILGSGSAGTLNGYLRSMTSPWVFEMSYNAVLFHGGIVGLVLYVSSLISLGKYINEKYRSYPINKASIICFITCVIANATNPYFSSSFDFLIMLVGPLFLTMAYQRECIQSIRKKHVVMLEDNR